MTRIYKIKNICILLMSHLRISYSRVFEVGTSVLYHIHLNHFAYILKIDYNSSRVIENEIDLNLQYPFSYLLSNHGKDKDAQNIFLFYYFFNPIVRHRMNLI